MASRSLPQNVCTFLRVGDHSIQHRGVLFYVKTPTEIRNRLSSSNIITVATADRLAGRAWDDEFNQILNHATAPRFRHAGDIQVITSEGSIAGQIPKQLPELITADRGLAAPQKATELSDEAMELLDDEATL